MSKFTETLDKRITSYLTDIHEGKVKVQELEAKIKDLKKEVSHQKSLARKYRLERNALKKKLENRD